VALNVFWRSHEALPCANSPLYDKKDLYGNRDPPSATQALAHVEAATIEISSLPEPFRSFYAKRASNDLLAIISTTKSHQSNYPTTTLQGGVPGEDAPKGLIMPLLGFGTYEADPKLVTNAVRCRVLTLTLTLALTLTLTLTLT